MTFDATPSESLQRVRSVLDRLGARMRFHVLGRDEVVDLVLVALMADGHVLLEDYPGSGKTTLAKALGEALEGASEDFPAFRRIQFTPDLLPSDITGVSVFEPGSGDFHFRPGPLFAHIVLADEINRTSPKVQAAMLEAMAEKQVTVDDVTRPLGSLFFVIATQNPRDVAGTYPLPLPQLDRFLFRIPMEPVSREAELAVLSTRLVRRQDPEALPRVAQSELLEAREEVERSVHVAPAVEQCLVDLARALRAHPQVLQGVSTRSLVLMVPALKVAAALRGRDYVSGEDVAWLAPRVFAHRMEVGPGAPRPADLVAACLEEPMEALSRSTLQAVP
jgi:MoxR-like ATPase